MKGTPFEKIIVLLDKHDTPYQLIEHGEVFTSEEAAAVRGVSLEEGAKSLLLKTENGFVLAIIPGSAKLSTQKLRALLGVRDARFASPEEVEEVMGCKIGACYPLAPFLDIPIVIDRSQGNQEYISFNPGVHNKTIRMKYTDFRNFMGDREADIIKE